METPEKIPQGLGTIAKNVVLPPRSAGHKMTTKVPLANREEKVSDVRQRLITNADNYETINYVYIVSKSIHPKGVVNIKKLLKSDPEKKIGDIMTKKLVKANYKIHLERVAHIAVKNNIKAVPLVDDKDVMVGVVPSDVILATLARESRDDLMKLSGIILGKGKLWSGDVVDSPFHSFITRVPWILVGLLGGMVTATVITSFDDVLAEHLILASFIPLVAYIANAVGNQTQTLYIRDLATQPKFPLFPYAVKQYAVALMISLASWVLLLVLSMLIWSSFEVGLIVGLSITLAVMTATSLALIIPRILDSLGFDPATGSGPFGTVIQDFLSILIYLTTASLLI